MVSTGRQMLGFALAVIGFLGTFTVFALPMWKVKVFIGDNLVARTVTYEGLWKYCVTQGTGQMQCNIYDPPLALPQDLQTARALVLIALLVSAFGVILSIAGGKCTNFVEDASTKAKVAIAAGIIFICAGVLILIPICRSSKTIMTNAHMGAALYIGWGTAALLLLGGALLCSSCPPKDSPENPFKYSSARSTATSRADV